MYVLKVEIHREITIEELIFLFCLYTAFFLLLAKVFQGFAEENGSKKKQKNFIERQKELEKMDGIPIWLGKTPKSY